MTDMQTSLPLLIVRPSILNPVINFSTHIWPVKWKYPRLYLCLAHSTPTSPTLMQHMHQSNHKWYDPLHIIMWPWSIDLDLTCTSPLHRSIGAKSCSSFTVTHGPSLQSLWLALHTCNRSVEPSLILIFATLVTWLHVLSHMQWASSWYHHMWTNLLCISHNHILVHLSCHSITKTKQGPFNIVPYFVILD
jgi:hypothetical protein